MTGCCADFSRPTRACCGAIPRCIRRPTTIACPNWLACCWCSSALQAAAAGLDAGEILASLESEVTRQFHSDGVGAEQSPTYAAYSIEWFTLAAIVAETSGLTVSDTYRMRLGAAIEHLQWLFDEAGRPPRIGDDDEGRVLALTLEPEAQYPASVAAMTARWLGQAGPSGELHDSALRDLAGPLPTSAPTEPRLGVRQFPEGGYTVRRWPSAKGQLVLSFDHGPLGFLSIAAHGHADALSIWLSWGDEPVLVDAGTYLYHAGGTRRAELRGTGSHNTLAIGVRTRAASSAFAWADHANTQLVSHRSNRGRPLPRRWRKRRRPRAACRLGEGDTSLSGCSRWASRSSLAWRSGLSCAPGCRVDRRQPRLGSDAGRASVQLVSEGASWSR